MRLRWALGEVMEAFRECGLWGGGIGDARRFSDVGVLGGNVFDPIKEKN